MKKIIKEIIPYVVIIVVVILIRSFIIDPVTVVGDSMYPTLKDGEVLILNRLDYKFNKIKRYDIIVVKNSKEHLIKRVIGLPGEHIKYAYGNLYVNDEIVSDFYSKDTANYDISELGVDVIPKDKYLVLGDNREVSLDSRMLGLISINEIDGSTNFRLWPFNRFGSISKNDEY